MQDDLSSARQGTPSKLLHLTAGILAQLSSGWYRAPPGEYHRVSGDFSKIHG
jgi:hypothetical protein